MTRAQSAIIVGAGHNGLVCAGYLARAGLQVQVLEARATVGGAASTTDFGQGYRVSGLAHILHSFSPKVVKDLGLIDAGLDAGPAIDTISLDREGKHIRLGMNDVSGAGLTEEDIASYSAFKNEFRSLTDIDHPNLVSLYELMKLGGEWLFTMELVEGGSFLDYVRPGDPAVQTTVDGRSSDADDADTDATLDIGSDDGPALRRPAPCDLCSARFRNGRPASSGPAPGVLRSGGGARGTTSPRYRQKKTRRFRAPDRNYRQPIGRRPGNLDRPSAWLLYWRIRRPRARPCRVAP